MSAQLKDCILVPQETYSLEKKHPMTSNTLYKVFGATMEAKWMVWYRIEKKANMNKRM
jgi:hypothetical protein